jgi:hypothetical protein
MPPIRITAQINAIARTMNPSTAEGLRLLAGQLQRAALHIGEVTLLDRQCPLHQRIISVASFFLSGLLQGGDDLLVLDQVTPVISVDQGWKWSETMPARD